MKELFTLKTLKTILNIGGTALLAVGVWELPIDLSFRLIILGVLSLIAWYTLET